MNVASLRLRGFGAYALGTSGGPQLELVLEPGTLYLVTGANGAGKSTLVEAVAYALWGRSLRGEHMLHPESGDPRPWVSVTVDGLRVERARRYGQTKLYFGPADQGAPTGLGAELDSARRLGAPAVDRHGTAKEAQVELDSYVGTFERWRRTHVFSSADAAHFSLATDGERKRLIEGFLGLERFDEALEACRADLKSAERRLEVAQDTEQRLGEDLDRALAQLQEPASDEDPKPEALPEPPVPMVYVPAAELALGECYQARLDHAERGATERARADEAEATLGRLGLGAPCPACGRRVTQRVLRAARSSAQAAAAVSAEAASAAEAEAVRLKEREQHYRRQLQEARAASQLREDWERREKERGAWRQRRDRAEAALGRAHQEAANLRRDLTQAEQARASALRERNELRACEQVLGLRGVRASVLARALSGAEALANSWLGRLGKPEMRLSLKPYTEKASGAAVDSIGVQLSTGGEYRPYRSASGGERRRADVALLLALGELAAASSGRERGVLFLDEVLDALDQGGQEAAIEAFLELARKEPSVVLITHAGLGDLLRGKPGVVRLHVAEGKLSRLE